MQKSGRGGGRWDEVPFGAKRQEMRERRVPKAIEILSEGIKHP